MNDTQLYAVQFGGAWRIAAIVPAASFGKAGVALYGTEETPVWFDTSTDALVCEVGNESVSIPLTDSPENLLCREILSELDRARAKFPRGRVTFAALVEEVGELAKATFEEPKFRVDAEAVQVAVMAMRMVLDGDETHDIYRNEVGLDSLSGADR